MERVKVHLPAQFNFSTNIKIRITDINYGGHVGNNSFLSLVHEARQQFLNNFGYSEFQIENVALIQADAVIEFKKELNYGDTVKISVAATEFDKYGFDFFYKLEIITDESTVLCARAKTGMLCYDYGNKKLIPLPEKVIHVLSNK
jgi:acyl-CoA thioester hydrolase